MNIPARIYKLQKKDSAKGYDRVFYCEANVVGYATEGELNHGSGELYAVAIIEREGELNTVPVGLVTLDHSQLNEV